MLIYLVTQDIIVALYCTNADVSTLLYSTISHLALHILHVIQTLIPTLFYNKSSGANHAPAPFIASPLFSPSIGPIPHLPDHLTLLSRTCMLLSHTKSPCLLPHYLSDSICPSICDMQNLAYYSFERLLTQLLRGGWGELHS